MTRDVDLVVIGTGSAGSIPAYKCRAAGWNVAVVDQRPFGGTCALRGCDPKKVLVGAAEAIDWHARLAGRGVLTGRPAIDWPALMRFKTAFTEPVPEAREHGFQRNGIETFHGAARFLDPSRLQIGGETLQFRHAVVASGAEPASLGIPGEEWLSSSDQFLELEALPRKIVFVGGGYISFEFAHIAARAGAEATILHRGPSPLRNFDVDLVARLVEATRETGIGVHLETPVRSIDRQDGVFRVHAGAEANPRVFEADLVVHGAGRVPAVRDLDLDAAGIEWSAAGVHVSEYLQSVTNKAVYAAGDAAATGNPPLTPAAGAEGHVAASNLIHGNNRAVDVGPIPSVVFTVPPLAALGMTDAEARESGLRFRVETRETSGWYSSKRIAETCSAYKVVIEEDTGRILGAHLLGAESAEVINIFAVAMRAGMTGADLQRMAWAYPSRSSDVSYMV